MKILKDNKKKSSKSRRVSRSLRRLLSDQRKYLIRMFKSFMRKRVKKKLRREKFKKIICKLNLKGFHHRLRIL